MEAARRKKLEKILSRVLAEIRPSKLEIAATTAHVNEISGRIREIAPKDVEIMVVGSIARGTNLSGNSDIDIFLLFDRKRYGREGIVKMGLQYAKSIVKAKKNERYELRYAEHPYTRLYLDDEQLRIDIVPAFRIEQIGEMGTAVDRTPLHTEFINSKLSLKQKEDVRLLKFLLKAHNIYGAEVKTKGFSGYLCELLVYSFGSFLNVLEWMAYMKPPVCVYPAERRYDGNEGLLKRFSSQFVVVDPVDPNRNVAAGVSIDALARFAMLARSVIANPSIRLFYGTGFSAPKASSLIRRFSEQTGLEPYTVITRVPDKSEDIVWPQLNRLGEVMEGALNRNGFMAMIRTVWIRRGKGFIMFFFGMERIKANFIKGPSVFAGNFSSQFMKKHSKAMAFLMKDNILYAVEKNKHETAEDFLRWLLKNGRIVDKKDVLLSKARVVRGIPKEFAEDAYAELLKKISL